MSESENADEMTFTFQELYEHETRNMAGCDNDDSCCTFPKGYVNRQALYNCVTCKDITGKPAGICFPCSVHCHSGHILEDLYTKRKFRCDCGNSNFPPSFRCTLWEEKDDVNIKNNYNHNFSGLYCVCDIQYDENKDTEEMFQCIVCEDWYHLKHLSDKENEIESLDLDHLEEFICKLCLAKHEHLQIYSRASRNHVLSKYDVKTGDCLCYLLMATRALGSLECVVSGYTFGAFMVCDWRQCLCRCDGCVSRMKMDGTCFLLDNRDSYEHYYSNDKTEDDIKDQLSTLPFSQAIQYAEGVATLKEALSEFFGTVDPDKVVTVEDVNEFFDKLKRRRLGEQD